MRCARGLGLLAADWCWEAGHINPSPLCDEFPHGRTVVDVRVEIAQYDLRPYTCGVELLLRSFHQLIGPLPPVLFELFAAPCALWMIPCRCCKCLLVLAV